jgi:hypothetical protein
VLIHLHAVQIDSLSFDRKPIPSTLTVNGVEELIIRVVYSVPVILCALIPLIAIQEVCILPTMRTLDIIFREKQE